MIYTTAQRVVSSEGDTGINTFLRRYADNKILRERIDAADDHTEANDLIINLPYSDQAAHLQIPAGGNTVLSYLDLFFSEDINPNQIEQIIAAHIQIIENTNKAPRPIRHLGPGIFIYYYYRHDLQMLPLKVAAELALLAKHALGILTSSPTYATAP